jgi:hypothetical protein
MTSPTSFDRTCNQMMQLKKQASNFPQASVEQLRRYAHIYVDTQQRFHGVYSDKILSRRGLKLSGKLPYWNIESETADLDVIGLIEGSPLLTSEGQLCIFCHYLDQRAFDRLRECFGQATGKILARMTSSGRTVMVFPQETSPFMLKFTGDFFPPKLGFNNTLDAKNVRQSVENFLQQWSNPYLTPEPVGIVMPKIQFAFLQRRLPAPRDEEIGSDDVLLGTQVILSDAFASTQLGKRIFSQISSKDAWLENIFAPKIAELIDDSLQRRVAHLELHPQNLDILINTRTGEIRHLFVKDLEDMYQDPAAVAATGQLPRSLNITRDRAFGILGEYRSRFSLDRFYWEFLGQTLGEEQHSTRNAVANWLRERARYRYREQDLRLYSEYAKLFGNQRGDLFNTIAAIRDLNVKIDLQNHFQKNESARHELTKSEGTVISTSRLKAFTFSTTQPNLEFGYVGNIPVAISRDANGLIEHYYFKFEY